MGISSKQVTMVTAQGEVWLHELHRKKLTDFVLTIEYCKISDVIVVIKPYANTLLRAHIMVISTKIGTSLEKALAQTEMSLMIFFLNVAANFSSVAL